MAVFGLLLVCPAARAQSPLAGTYRCASVKVGTRSGQCASPPLVLKPNGTYQIWGEVGKYTIKGRWLILSESSKRGPGHWRTPREVVFEYTDRRGKKHHVTFRRERYGSAGRILA